MAGRHRQRSQRGAALLVFLVLLVMGALTWVVGNLTPESVEAARARKTADALAQARDALLGRVAATDGATAGYLPLPDLGNASEGIASMNFAGNIALLAAAGRLPWSSLGIAPLRDGAGECLWYVVAGRFKNQPWSLPPANSPLNWDDSLPGRLRLVDVSGNSAAENLAALVIAPGPPLAAQNRASGGSVTFCGGNYDALNYLDPFNAINAIGGAIHYFPGSINHRIAADSSDKSFAMLANEHYNDRTLAIEADAVFAATLQAHLPNLMGDPLFATVVIAGSKGTSNVDCITGVAATPASRRTLCHNWKEMLLLTRLNPPAPVTIDGTTTGNCSRVLIFGGKRTATQQRASGADKSDPTNYLEGPNLAAFAAPQAHSANFVGISRFSKDNPHADVMRCIP